ncbi:MAG TPA: DUF5691 domain-containing protein, partial [Longimicrobium sp.]|nr:DUF5691 domain-containing protein [Longimicrobium sp.]
PLLDEWLSLAAAKHFVAPPEHLPALLTMATVRTELRPLVLPVLGARGRWLARQEAKWAWAADVAAGPPSVEEEEKAWETGTADARATALARVRRVDPALARGWLERAWPKAGAKERVALFNALGVGLSPDDEEFLDAALDDRRREVRDAAARFLRLLPGSRLVARMTERARSLLRLEKPASGLLARLAGSGGKPRLRVELPAAYTPEMKRDGIDEKPHAGGERAYWLTQVVAATPPSVWSAEAPPAVWLEIVPPEWKNVLPGAWAAAAAAYRDAEWAEALLRSPFREVDVRLADLVGALSAERYRALLAELLGRVREVHWGHRSTQLLVAAPHPLDAGLTRLVLERIDPHAATNEYLMATAAQRMDPRATLDALSARNPAPSGRWVDLLHQRHALHEAFAS